MHTPTTEEIESARTPRGGWTKKTLIGWGIPWPPPRGWKKRLLSGSIETPERQKDRVDDLLSAVMENQRLLKEISARMDKIEKDVDTLGYQNC